MEMFVFTVKRMLPQMKFVVLQFSQIVNNAEQRQHCIYFYDYCTNGNFYRGVEGKDTILDYFLKIFTQLLC